MVYYNILSRRGYHFLLLLHRKYLFHKQILRKFLDLQYIHRYEGTSQFDCIGKEQESQRLGLKDRDAHSEHSDQLGRLRELIKVVRIYLSRLKSLLRSEYLVE